MEVGTTMTEIIQNGSIHARLVSIVLTVYLN